MYGQTDKPADKLARSDHSGALRFLPALRSSARWWGACLVLGSGLGLGAAPPAQAFDHTHGAWNSLLQENVVLISGGNASQIRYAQMARERAPLGTYLRTLSAVPAAAFGRWSKGQRLAFLINAYNAFTIALILTKYPELKSIRDLGSTFSSPWKKEFVPLLGQTVSLDYIEHGMIRAPGAFDDPRIHAAVNCASIGCPTLRNEAFVAEKLDAQLDDSLARFLSDRSRNRYDAARGVLEVSKIFDWYRGDFEKGHRNIASLPALFARYADRLADDEASRKTVRAGQLQIEFLDYDWALNDASASPR